MWVYDIMRLNQSTPNRCATSDAASNPRNLGSGGSTMAERQDSTPRRGGVVVTCAHCGVTVWKRKFVSVPKYCSRECSAAAQRTAPAMKFRCEACGAECERQRNMHLAFKYCSPACNYIGKVKHPDEHFWPKVDKSGECWIWTGGTDGYGYGKVNYLGRRQKTHRLSWMLIRGPIPDGLSVLHNCPTGDNPACCNPAHLWLGTNADNMRDMAAKGRASKGEAHHWARKSEGDVLRIIVLRFAGWSNRAIADYFSIPKTSVESIVYGSTWKHLGDHR